MNTKTSNVIYVTLKAVLCECVEYIFKYSFDDFHWLLSVTSVRVHADVLSILVMLRFRLKCAMQVSFILTPVLTMLLVRQYFWTYLHTKVRPKTLKKAVVVQ